MLLHIFLSYDTPFGYSKECFATPCSNGLQTLPIFDSILDIFKGKLFEHQVEIDANQILSNESIRHEVLTNSSLEFNMPVLNYNLLGFNISATNIEVNASSKQASDEGNKKRIDFLFMLAENVNVSNGIINQNFNDVDLSSIYAIYDPQTDKFTFHIPFDVAARYIMK
jgi:hypothetical protein